MDAPPVLIESQVSHACTSLESDEAKAVILRELEKILESPPFRGSSRRKEFLSYVVHHSLEGRHELLKERIIGTEVFHRDADYATGDDPVVRVQAGEVRRRLEQYYYSAPDVLVRIEIPTGSYSPVFHWTATAPQTQPTSSEGKPAEKAKSKLISRRWWWSIAGLCIIAALFYTAVQWSSRQETAFQQFWDPLFSTQQPALICLAQGVTYRPSEGLYDRYANTHPGTYQTEVERSTIPLPMDPKEKILWGDMEFEEGYGVAVGDVSAALKFSTLLGHLGKTNQARIGRNYSFEDLRNSPAIVIGAFNNRWTIDMLSNLRFAFVIENGEYKIREQVPGGRAWASVYSKAHKLEEDYGIVARLLGSKTGQFTVAAAGLRDSGTEAAAELASNPEFLTAAIRNAPNGWQNKNVEIIFKTSLTDSIPGPPQIVAIYYW
jgi:hypothetical protein